ncbi:MAG: TonB-dependent receptor [bacterium]|nr:TonB-dependent receptor [bacterium]
MNFLKSFKEIKIEAKALIRRQQKRSVAGIIMGIVLCGNALTGSAQTGINDLNYEAKSEFVPTIKDAIKFSDLPEIKDTVKKVDKIKYGIVSKPLFAKYEAQTIEAAKLQNEPLSRLYNSLLKIGYGPIYNMPYAEFWIANTRSKEAAFGAHLKHFSSTTHLKDVGYGGFSDNTVNVFGKKFYKKHTLNGDFNYDRNVIHYYGYDTTINHLENDYTKQRYQLIEPKLLLTSHYNDSTHINHAINLGFYNYQNLYRESESNVKLKAKGEMFINKEKFNLNFLTDYYNHKQANDTFNDLIVSINPSFEASGKKWRADIGVTGTLDNMKNVSRFYFYPQLNLQYDIYENLIIPYVGATGGLIKNSFRSLSAENPFVDTTVNSYMNTNNKINLFGGLRGNLSSNTSYDAKVNFAQYDNLHFFVIDYSGPNQIYNQFNLLYDAASVLTVSGQLKYQMREKLNLIAKGGYYIYNTKTLTRAYHKPDYDLTLSGIYNLQSKIILRADLFFMGKQWALSQFEENGSTVLKPKQINGWADLNLEAEYRYSKMLSFFARVNNIANQRYYRWERYPSQRFNFMIGLSFVPF